MSAGGGLPDDGWVNDWSMSVADITGVIFSVLMLRLVVIGYILGLWAVCLVSGSWSPKQCQVWVPAHEIGLKSNHILVGYSHKLCANIALANILGRKIVKISAGLVFMFLLVTWRYLPVPKTLEHGGKGSLWTPARILHLQWVMWVLSSVGSCWQFVENSLLSWQQPGLFGDFHVTVMPTSVRWNKLGEKWPVETLSSSLFGKIIRIDYIC